MPAATEPEPYLIPLSLDGSELLSIDTGATTAGWAAYFSPAVTQLAAEVLLRIAPQPPTATAPAHAGHHRETALEVREMRIIAGEHAGGFTSSLLREIPILRIEAAINQDTHRRRLLGVLTTADARPVDPAPGGARYRRPPTRRPTLAARPLTIEDPGGYRKPDAFYQHIADLYSYQAAISTRPAHELAEANNVPVATVHRWIREAKARRLLLLPAHRSGADRPDPTRPAQ